MAKSMVGASDNEHTNKITQVFGADTLKILRLAMSDWVINSFTSEVLFKAAFLALFQVLIGQTNQSKSISADIPTLMRLFGGDKSICMQDYLNLETIAKGELTKEEYAYLKEFCNIIVCKNFSYIKSFEREDLISVGVLKCIDLISKQRFDPERNSLKNFLWTGVRNEITNFLYRSSKESPVEEVFLRGRKGSLSILWVLYSLRGDRGVPSRFPQEVF